MKLVTTARLAAVFLAAAAVPVATQASEPPCPGHDGTVPGSGPSVTVIGQGDAEPYMSVYIDDRDGFDLDGDGDAGGIWIYVESNGRPGLQRGGEWLTDEALDALPEIDPIYVLPPDPDRPVYQGPVTLFPSGVSPGQYQLGSTDGCVEYDSDGNRIPADTLIF